MAHGAAAGRDADHGPGRGDVALYAHTVMPGLRRTDDRTFVGAFQALDRAIINPWFMAGGFLGALVLTVAATVATLGEPAFAWVVAAPLLYLFAFVATTLGAFGCPAWALVLRGRATG